jgi:hypothetical protein
MSQPLNGEPLPSFDGSIEGARNLTHRPHNFSDLWIEEAGRFPICMAGLEWEIRMAAVLSKYGFPIRWGIGSLMLRCLRPEQLLIQR